MPDPRRLFQDAEKATIRSDDKEQEDSESRNSVYDIQQGDV